MKLSDFDYTLPPDRIAQHPASPRDAAKLLVVDRGTGRFSHRIFRDLPGYLKSEDVLVINNTRVIPARLRAWKPTGGTVEVVLLRPAQSAPGPHLSVPADDVWEVLLRPGRRAQVGTSLHFSDHLTGEVVSVVPGGARMVRFTGSRGVLDVARDIGEMPVPPYVHEPLQRPDDYQTVYAAVDGAVAAPTAGLHFTPALLDHIVQMGVRVVTLTLHIGWGTFRPVTSNDPTLHRMDAEWFEVSNTAAATLRAVRGHGRVVVVGTSAVRTLETVASVDGGVQAGRGWSELFIYPGYRFAVTDALVTNFHLPKTTLLMLVCAFAGHDLILRAYQEAIAHGYRFYSFGDAMLIL
ncbi:MAG: tRNA preQ1(34) S-adenosylmethionine ribosyltransferase-isomerase QueA [Armatimonadetes bacterium 13_1_40CM_64_14]|nr:MAG: tRNA preQ1(34) S-adenosylmethionine ribosyltransferase-isomerase QueA [Armatimonadetes bacterium 13_1_40CM_64_14]